MEREVSHNEIYRELGELKGMMSALILRSQKDDDEKKNIFERIGKLETRMAQVVLVAVIASLTLPPIVSFLGQHLQLNLRSTAGAELLVDRR
jgi:hypothetical protein